jgi:hypothetical protein
VSSYAVVKEISDALKALLEKGFDEARTDHDSEDPFGAIVSGSGITLEAPFKYLKESEEDLKDVLSVYLYRAVENGHMKNRARVNSSGDFLPLAVDLYYLITPLTGKPQNDHLVMGRVMQLLHDNSKLRVVGSGCDSREEVELHITLCPISMEDITRIWSGFMRPYRLSLVYEVKVTYIDSERQRETQEVQRKQLEFSQKGRKGMKVSAMNSE